MCVVTLPVIKTCATLKELVELQQEVTQGVYFNFVCTIIALDVKSNIMSPI